MESRLSESDAQVSPNPTARIALGIWTSERARWLGFLHQNQNQNQNQSVRAEKITISCNLTTMALSHKITPRTPLNGSSDYEVECLPFSQGLHVNNSVWEVSLSIRRPHHFHCPVFSWMMRKNKKMFREIPGICTTNFFLHL
jgi:hypothetical protein